jgi:hypothetical protein
MIEIDDLRRSLESFADQARPAELGLAALDGARRRRRRQRISVTVVLLLLAGILVPITVLNLRHDAGPVVDLPAGPMRPHVVTAYAAGQKWYVIDPTAGRYRQVDGGSVVSVSPNLQLYTDLATVNGSSSVLRIAPTSGTGPNTFLTVAGWAVGAAWSPDGSWLVVPVLEAPDEAIKAEHGFTDIVLVDVLNGTMRRQRVDLDDRYGSWVQWADNSTLAVGTERQHYVGDGVAMVSRAGKVLSWRPLPAAQSCAPDGLPAMPPIHDGKLLTCTNNGSATEYHAFDPRRGTTGPALGQMLLPSNLRGIPVLWDGDDRPVLSVTDLKSDDGSYTVQVARLATGTLEDVPKGQPGAMIQVLVGSSDGLSAAGRKITF